MVFNIGISVMTYKRQAQMNKEKAKIEKKNQATIKILDEALLAGKERGKKYDAERKNLQAEIDIIKAMRRLAAEELLGDIIAQPWPGIVTGEMYSTNTLTLEQAERIVEVLEYTWNSGIILTGFFELRK